MKSLCRVVILLSASTAFSAAPQKPVRPNHFHVDGGIGARTVQELGSASTLVADVTFSSRSAAEEDSSGMVTTAYTATVREAFKKDAWKLVPRGTGPLALSLVDKNYQTFVAELRRLGG